MVGSYGGTVSGDSWGGRRQEGRGWDGRFGGTVSQQRWVVVGVHVGDPSKERV